VVLGSVGALRCTGIQRAPFSLYVRELEAMLLSERNDPSKRPLWPAAFPKRVHVFR
jgi:hypothetical protein